jgi:hypothetical protein
MSSQQKRLKPDLASFRDQYDFPVPAMPMKESCIA